MAEYLQMSEEGYILGAGVAISEAEKNLLIYGNVAYLRELIYKPDGSGDVQDLQNRRVQNDNTITAYDNSAPGNRPCNPVLNPPYNEQPMDEKGDLGYDCDYEKVKTDSLIIQSILVEWGFPTL